MVSPTRREIPIKNNPGPRTALPYSDHISFIDGTDHSMRLHAQVYDLFMRDIMNQNFIYS